MKTIFSQLILKIMGWTIIDSVNYPKKCLVIFAPHTSNWDFVIGRCYAYVVGIKGKYLIKSELFVSFLRYFFIKSGGIPVHRTSNNNLVDQIVKMYNNSDHLILGLSPEGTRKRVEKWKTGFYHIASHANIPIVLLKLDYKKKEIGIFNQIIASGNIEKDMRFIQVQFSDVEAKYPDQYNPNIY